MLLSPNPCRWRSPGFSGSSLILWLPGSSPLLPDLWSLRPTCVLRGLRPSSDIGPSMEIRKLIDRMNCMIGLLCIGTLRGNTSPTVTPFWEYVQQGLGMELEFILKNPLWKVYEGYPKASDASRSWPFYTYWWPGGIAGEYFPNTSQEKGRAYYRGMHASIVQQILVARVVCLPAPNRWSRGCQRLESPVSQPFSGRVTDA